MCYAVYIGTDVPCETSQWDEQDRKFYIEDLHERDMTVVQHFTKPHVYYAGSWQNCGCGFFSEPEWAEAEDELDEIQETERCITDLVAFLNRALETSNDVELFVCWEGDQSKPPERKYRVRPKELLGQSLPLKELDFVVVTKEK